MVHVQRAPAQWPARKGACLQAVPSLFLPLVEQGMAVLPSPQILMEDEQLLAMAKPSGMLSHGDEGAATALTWAQAREVQQGRDPAALHLVHRLDRETSGVLLLVRGAELAERVNAMFRERRVLKVYLALTSPVPALRWMRVEQRLQPQRIGQGERMQVVATGGLEASSEVEVLARGRRLGLVRVIPDQGRKHQVRVALAGSGAPIAGDFLYGGALSKQLARRVMLHARTLELAHPQTGQHLVIRAPVPTEFKALLAEDAGVWPPDLDVRHRVVVQTRDAVGRGTVGSERAVTMGRALPDQRTLPGRRPSGQRSRPRAR